MTREDKIIHRAYGLAESSRIGLGRVPAYGSFPRSDQFGIVAQVRRSSASVTANIAEGFGRGTTRELLRSLQISRGELEETRYFMLLSLDLGRIKKDDFETVNALCDSVGQMINALGRTLKARLARLEDSRVTSHRSRVTEQR